MAVVSFSAVLTLTVVAVIALSRADAAVEQLACGETITTDTTLGNDLLDCPNNGIVIGADDITLDLNGHRIDGDGTEFADCPKNTFCDVGVLDDRYHGVKIKGGSTQKFAVGVFLAGARRSRVVDVASSKNAFFGAVISNSSRSEVRDGSFSRNIPPEGDGIGLFDSDHITIAHNSITHNPGPGIHVGGSTHNVVKGNHISRSSPGIAIEESDRNEVRGNRFVGNSAGVIVAPGSHNVIARNHLSGDGDGIAIEKGRDNVVKRNLVVGARGDGIYLGLDAPPIGGVGNVVRRNEVKGSGDDGFDVRRKDNHSVLTRNLAVGSGDDGFDIESRSTRLAGNRARRNGDLGIAVRRGAIDRGGNRASGNGDGRQCVHVRCR